MEWWIVKILGQFEEVGGGVSSLILKFIYRWQWLFMPVSGAS